MLALRRNHVDADVVKGILLAILAIALAWAFGLRTAAGDPMQPSAPELMPPIGAARVLDEPETMPEFFPEQPKPLHVDRDLAARLHAIVQLHAAGDNDKAAAMWRQTVLPPDGEVWRRVALAAFALENGKLEQAAEELDQADFLAPRNPLVAYFTGQLRMRQAARAEAIDPGVIALLAYPPEIPPAVRGMFELAAMQSLNQSIAWRDEVNLADPLVAETGKEGPTVGDLLEAMKTADYVGRAHHTLGWLYLDRGQAEQAEKHFDGAVKDGVRVPWGYRKLGQWFEREDNPQGAFRAYLKHLGQYGEGAVLPARDAWRNLGEMFRG